MDGSGNKGGAAGAGRALRVDARRSFDSGAWSVSVGAGGSAAVYPLGEDSELRNVDLAKLHGFSGDIERLHFLWLCE